MAELLRVSGVISFVSWKTDIAGAEWHDHAAPTDDIFSNVKPRQWHLTARYLIDSKDTVVYSADLPDGSD